MSRYWCWPYLIYLELLHNLFTRFLKCLHLLQLFSSDVLHPYRYLPQSSPAVCDGCSRSRRMSQTRCPRCVPITCFSLYSPTALFQHITSPTWPKAAGKVCQNVQQNKSRSSEACKSLSSPTKEAERIVCSSVPG